jgi:hypothetical protein
VDPDVRLLELAPRSSDLHSRQNFDLRTTKVDVIPLGGRSGGLYGDFGPERMLDSNPDSFWADIVLTDGPVAQEYHPSGDAGLGSKIESEGVIVHVVLTLSHVAIANNLKILPFGEFPIRVVDIAYKESTAQGQWLMLPGFQVEDATLDWIEVNFEPKTVAQLRITLEQTNYRVTTYHLPENAVRNSLLWQSITETRLNDEVFQLDLANRFKSKLEINPGLISTLAADEDFRQALDQVDIKSDRQNDLKLNLKLTEAAASSLTKAAPELKNKLLEAVTGEKDADLNRTLAIRKYEYLYGLRSVELRYNLYQPLGHYSSPKFTSNATVLDVSILTDERHPSYTDGLGNFYKTSAEWELELGQDRRYPIAPKNWRVVADSANEALKTAEAGNPSFSGPGGSVPPGLRPTGSGNFQARPEGAGTFIVVPDEYLSFDRITRTAITRLPIAYLGVVLRKNGTRVRMDKYHVGKLTLPDPYTNSTLEPASRTTLPTPTILQGRGLITFTDTDEFDPNAVYTVQYVARDDADLLRVDGELNSTPLIDPELFTKTNRDHAIVLSRFPYIDYNIVNSAAPEDVEGGFASDGTSSLVAYKWIRDDKLEARWRFQPTLPNYKVGTIAVTNGSINVTGSSTQWLANVDMTEPNVLRVRGSESMYKLQSVSANTSLALRETFKGTSGSGLQYVVGQYFESDGIIYGLDNMIYEPIRVYINDVKAANLTNYSTFEHQAFTTIPKNGRQYQYIHSGNILYFNAPISEGNKIEVVYSYLTEYVRVNAVLRCNIPVQTILTPTVGSIRIDLRTSKL